MPADVLAFPTSTALAEQPTTAVRPGSRADRMAQPLARHVLREVAETNGVCVRPIVIRRIDRATGRTDIIEAPCGARLAADCKPCAERTKRLRVQQLREGWHLDNEPTPAPQPPSDEALALVRLRAELEFDYDQALRGAEWDQLAELQQAIDSVDQALSQTRLRGTLTPPDRQPKPRRKRSTRRRQDVPDLPRLPVANRTVGKVYIGRDGKPHRPSTLLTVTLPSYGPVHTANRRGNRIGICACGALHGTADPLLGTPIDPTTYDYRAAALDAIHFARVLDRFWQNLRRAAGWNIQYAGTIELQKRLTPHAHFCMRGTLPRRLVHQVAEATYHQVWWPAFDTPTYPVTRPPVWDVDQGGYVDPDTRQPLPTWQQALDTLDDPDATPAYVARLGRVDPRGIEPGTGHADRAIRYVTKYLTKDLTEHADISGDPQQAHADRLHAELSVLPCSPGCANWLLYGVQPSTVRPGHSTPPAGLVPGHCSGKVHQPRTLGFTGRRVLITRQWSGKTLTDHRADNRAWIRTILAGALADDDDQVIANPDDPNRYRFELANPDDPDIPPYEHRILRAIATRQRWREALQHARAGPPSGVPATPTQPVTLAA